MLIGVGISVLYWLLNAATMTFVFHSGTLVEELFHPDEHHLWMRIPTVLLLFAIVVLVSGLRRAHTEVKILRGLIPICAWCKKVRDDQGYWTVVEAYVQQHTTAEFTHGMCPDCYDKQMSSLNDATGKVINDILVR